MGGLGHGLKVFSARLGQVAALHAREVAAAPARGHAGPTGRPPRLDWARRTALCEGEVPMALPWSTAKTSMHSYAGGSQVVHVAGTARTRLRALGAAIVALPLLVFHVHAFEYSKLQKVITKSKISKNKSCRRAIDLQLSQRASYVLIDGFVENRDEVAVFPRLGLLFTAQSTRFFANLHSKLECPPITKNVFPEITNNFRIGRF
jgi:hypothetical protein